MITLNNAHAITQQLTNNGFRNTKEHPKFKINLFWKIIVINLFWKQRGMLGFYSLNSLQNYIVHDSRVNAINT